MQLKAEWTAFFSFSFLKFAEKSQETSAGVTCICTLFSPSESTDIKSVIQEYGETTETQKAVGDWLCGYAEQKQPFDKIKHRHTLKEVGDVAEGAYDWKIERSLNKMPKSSGLS